MKDQIVDYKICRDPLDVVACLRNGWELYGSPFAIFYGTYESVDLDGRIVQRQVFQQAVVRNGDIDHEIRNKVRDFFNK